MGVSMNPVSEALQDAIDAIDSMYLTGLHKDERYWIQAISALVDMRDAADEDERGR